MRKPTTTARLADLVYTLRLMKEGFELQRERAYHYAQWSVPLWALKELQRLEKKIEQERQPAKRG